MVFLNTTIMHQRMLTLKPHAVTFSCLWLGIKLPTTLRQRPQARVLVVLLRCVATVCVRLLDSSALALRWQMRTTTVPCRLTSVPGAELSQCTVAAVQEHSGLFLLTAYRTKLLCDAHSETIRLHFLQQLLASSCTAAARHTFAKTVQQPPKGLAIAAP
jgi:urea transporter